MAKKKPKPKSDEPIPFEQSLDRLKQIVAQLENGNLSLSQSLDQYEQGVANLKQCYEALNAAQRKIEMLVELDEEGNLVTLPFDDTASVQMAEGTRRRSRTPSTAKPDAEDEEGDAEFEDESEDDEYEDMDDPNSLF